MAVTTGTTSSAERELFAARARGDSGAEGRPPEDTGGMHARSRAQSRPRPLTALSAGVCSISASMTWISSMRHSTTRWKRRGRCLSSLSQALCRARRLAKSKVGWGSPCVSPGSSRMLSSSCFCSPSPASSGNKGAGRALRSSSPVHTSLNNPRMRCEVSRSRACTEPSPSSGKGGQSWVMNGWPSAQSPSLMPKTDFLRRGHLSPQEWSRSARLFICSHSSQSQTQEEPWVVARRSRLSSSRGSPVSSGAAVPRPSSG
mmetsp:Transcript_32215/g.93491  ORF Transcript_32215/g.93491 Transcript_32215/m.93491 type:complete len:259 (-) Transcript_32215:177-953(-)